MNKTIQKLADQCRTEYHNGYGGFTEQFDEEKFAKLIVRECIQFCGHPDSIRVKSMKSHFGIDDEQAN